ncbi:polypeptide N-acetylgalactosaminyltransferase 8 [Rhinolophus ferrumequinum]|uniref:Polypeptide N-acetylgalactosaminyltransferase 8 n=1 Tax=Rhinolophus ferrumequinum TaxID=59479 RepID=A0A7J7WPR4_RHIFE|nr:polypeptide N-acetylgalactosaminyltransferase 8 [Rhinolophus ferrumequinum]
MMLRRNVYKVLCFGLILVIAYNLFLVFYTKAILQKLILSSLQKELHLPLSEWNGTVIKRLSHLELDFQHLRNSMFFQDPSAPCQVIGFNLVVDGAADWPMWESNRRPWCYEHRASTTEPTSSPKVI